MDSMRCLIIIACKVCCWLRLLLWVIPSLTDIFSNQKMLFMLTVNSG